MSASLMMATWSEDEKGFKNLISHAKGHTGFVIPWTPHKEKNDIYIDIIHILSRKNKSGALHLYILTIVPSGDDVR
jgi:hypothetical protein